MFQNIKKKNIMKRENKSIKKYLTKLLELKQIKSEMKVHQIYFKAN